MVARCLVCRECRALGASSSIWKARAAPLRFLHGCGPAGSLCPLPRSLFAQALTTCIAHGSSTGMGPRVLGRAQSVPGT
ncbi:unnamed protein product [Amoebophrya sp. A120]|nr:unnamed protein product [Amoebophrya sp. A120]|eukprot:GSA120T00018361001.1